MKLEYGVLTISLDFELYWGVRDQRSIEEYKTNLDGVREAVPEILRLFERHKVHATWATVGFLFFSNFQNLKQHTPAKLPSYTLKKLSPYNYIDALPGAYEKYHFAPDLIDLIMGYEGQEIGSHTFSHYYCLEEGQSLEEFENDLHSSVEIARSKGIDLRSLIFPRNQYNTDYLPSLTKFGIRSFRGNEENWFNKASGSKVNQFFLLWKRAVRLLDNYIKLSRHNTYEIADCIREKPYNFPSSRFLRAYSAKLSFFERLKLKRIKDSMTYAANHNEIYHLWWHPHNFGTHLDKNLHLLEEILKHYDVLHNRQNMISLHMNELSSLADKGNRNG